MYAAISIKVVPEQGALVEYERERFAGNCILFLYTRNALKAFQIPSLQSH